MAIVIDKLRVAYGDTVVLDGTSAELELGRIHAIMGPSGAGKTTLLRAVLGLVESSGGAIGGTEGMSKAAVFQEPRLAENLSAVANVRLAAGCTADEARELLRALGLADELDKPARELSGGQQSRAAIARALAKRADLTVFDEPLTGLDADTKELVCAKIAAELAGRTALWVTHDADEFALIGDVCLWRLGAQGTMVCASS